jgi:hypothetical protein
MKTSIFFLLFVFTFTAHAACRCSCDPQDMRLCANNYDLEYPCQGDCPSIGPGIPPMRTACPSMHVYNAFTKTMEWRVVCF